jgi:hypothetical protein
VREILDFGFWISDFGLKRLSGVGKGEGWGNPKSKIKNPK